MVSRALAGGAIGAGAGALNASWLKDEFGIPDEFVKQVGTMVQPGDSAIYALLRTANPDIVANQFRGYGGTILGTTLNRDQQSKVESLLQQQGGLALQHRPLLKGKEKIHESSRDKGVPGENQRAVAGGQGGNRWP